ncbi:MAG TPA: PAS domain S-box protein [Steroidobacteraceae bacterium]|nr:PAS domain S-box protein [Steroidobacteraceae bacterium]
MGPKPGRKSTIRSAGVPAAVFEPDFRALVAAAGDIIYTLDLEGRFTSLNPAAFRVFEYEPEEMLGRDFVDFLTPESADIARRHFQQGLLGTENTPFFDVEARAKSGRVIHLEVRAGSLFQNGVRVGRQGIARDISELKALQAQVTEKSARVALLEERTRIALGLYARIAGLAREDAGDGASPDAALRQVQVAVLHASAEKIGLTAFDLRVLELLSKGRSNREIALQVHRSPHTIKDHIKKIMQRLGATRRAELVATALGLGLIPAEI